MLVVFIMEKTINQIPGLVDLGGDTVVHLKKL